MIDARAPNADVAAALAEAASRQLVLEVLTDQAERADASSQLGAKVQVPTTEATRLQPTDRSVLLGGTLAAVDILLVAVMVGILLHAPLPAASLTLAKFFRERARGSRSSHVVTGDGAEELGPRPRRS